MILFLLIFSIICIISSLLGLLTGIFSIRIARSSIVQSEPKAPKSVSFYRLTGFLAFIIFGIIGYLALSTSLELKFDQALYEDKSLIESISPDKSK